jgi:hypothetical protein
MVGIVWFYKFYRLYKNGKIVSLIKAIGQSWFGLRVYIEPPHIAPGIFVKR